jgi:hypothetical protein
VALQVEAWLRALEANLSVSFGEELYKLRLAQRTQAAGRGRLSQRLSQRRDGSRTSNSSMDLEGRPNVAARPSPTELLARSAGRGQHRATSLIRQRRLFQRREKLRTQIAHFEAELSKARREYDGIFDSMTKVAQTESDG